MSLATFSAPTDIDPCLQRRIDLAVVIPTYNERGNIPELIARLECALQSLSWELIFVDDDSPDETADLIADYARPLPTSESSYSFKTCARVASAMETVLRSRAVFRERAGNYHSEFHHVPHHKMSYTYRDGSH